MPDIKNIADKADIIVNGYAFTRADDGIHVLNLNSPDKAVVFSADGEVLETTSVGLSTVRRAIMRSSHTPSVLTMAIDCSYCSPHGRIAKNLLNFLHHSQKSCTFAAE